MMLPAFCHTAELRGSGMKNEGINKAVPLESARISVEFSTVSSIRPLRRLSLLNLPLKFVQENPCCFHRKAKGLANGAAL